MLLSDLILKAQEIYSQHGDVQVLIRNERIAGSVKIARADELKIALYPQGRATTAQIIPGEAVGYEYV